MESLLKLALGSQQVGPFVLPWTGLLCSKFEHSHQDHISINF